MSVLRPLLSRRGRLVFVATSLLLIAALVAAPGVSGARQAVKQFTATISPTDATGGVAGSWTMTVTNCGGTGTPDPKCTLASTIGLGSIRIAVPTEFRPIGSQVASSPNWIVSYDSATGSINANVTAGSNKLQPGQSVDITFSATPEICASGIKTFMTSAWGSTTVSGTDPFVIQSPQPTVTVAANGSCVTSGGTVTGPNGQTETIDGDFQGHVNVTFGGDIGPDCGGADFGALGDQWQVYHLPTQVTITPASDFEEGTEDKISTSEFPLPSGGGDSSWFLICYAVPKDADHPAFETRGDGTAIEQSIGGIPHWVGILASCADAPTPCVSEQFLTTGQPNPSPPWSPSANKVHIAVRMDPGDPYKR
jgi:hypothetical protein